MSCFVAWGDKLAAEGPAAFTARATLPTTRPATSGCWGWWGAIRAALHIAYESKWTYFFLLALVPSLCDCGLAWLVYRTAKRSSRGVKEHTALVLTAFTAFNPLMLFDTGVWKRDRRRVCAAACSALCCWSSGATCPPPCCTAWRWHQSPQALFGPVLAVCYLAAIALERTACAPLAAALAARRWHCCRRC